MRLRGKFDEPEALAVIEEAHPYLVVARAPAHGPGPNHDRADAVLLVFQYHVATGIKCEGQDNSCSGGADVQGGSEVGLCVCAHHDLEGEDGI